MTMASNDGMLLETESSSLSPLPLVLHRGLAAVAVLACISLASTAAVFLYLTYKIIKWRIGWWKESQVSRYDVPDLNLGLEQRHFDSWNKARTDDAYPDTERVGKKSKAPNQFLILIFNLFLADIHQAGAFLLNAVWVNTDGIWVGTSTCFAQGWLVSTGDLASSCFISAIAIHTYFAVVWNYKFPQMVVNMAMVAIWAFVYIMAISGVATTKNGQDGGGFYVRAAAWCWVNIKYEKLRLVLHYLWIFISIVLTSVLYILIFISVRRRNKISEATSRNTAASNSNRTKPSADTRRASHAHHTSSISGMMQTAQPTTSPTPALTRSAAHHPAFLVYPIIYVVCTAPLALGRVATMAGVNVPLSYFCVAGALITSNGWLDVSLWSITRRELIYNADVDREDVGLETFGFMRTPPHRQFGNMIWVEGAAAPASSEDTLRETKGRASSNGDGWVAVLPRFSRRWFGQAGGGSSAFSGGVRKGHGSLGALDRRPGARSVSQESLRGQSASNAGLAIQMDTVTTVEVEVDVETKKVLEREIDLDGRHRRPSTYSGSENSSDKSDVLHRV